MVPWLPFASFQIAFSERQRAKEASQKARSVSAESRVSPSFQTPPLVCAGMECGDNRAGVTGDENLQKSTWVIYRLSLHFLDFQPGGIVSLIAFHFLGLSLGGAE